MGQAQGHHGQHHHGQQHHQASSGNGLAPPGAASDADLSIKGHRKRRPSIRDRLLGKQLADKHNGSSSSVTSGGGGGAGQQQQQPTRTAVVEFVEPIVEEEEEKQQSVAGEKQIAPEPAPRPLKDKEHIFTPPELWGRYEFVRYLGRGAYGHVCEAKHKQTGQRVAIKKIMNVFENRQEAKRILRECRILRVLKNCAYISDVVEVLPPPDFNNFRDLLIVFEFVDTDLSKIIEHTDQYFTVRHVQYFLWQLLLGLKFIHSAHIVHRDLKPANVLINENCSLKICDFGLSRGLDSNQHHRSPSGGEHLSASVLTPPAKAAKTTPRKSLSAKQELSTEGPQQETSVSSDSNTLSAGSALKNGSAGGGGRAGRKNSFIAEEVEAQSIAKMLQRQAAAAGDDDDNPSNAANNEDDNDDEDDVDAQFKNDVIPKRPTMDRTLTRHVVTRYYRAPEVLLSAKYNTGVDIWAVGCILGDLLGMQRENNPNRMERAPLFPGTYSSFSPLNPELLRRDPESAASHIDQLKVVFNVIGTPTKKEIEALECHPNTKNYLLRLRNVPKMNFERKFPARGNAACYCWQRRTNEDEPWSYFSQLSNEELSRLYKGHQVALMERREAAEKGETDLPAVGPTSVRYNQSVWEVDFEKYTLSSPDYPTYHIRRVNAGLDLLDRLLQFDVSKRLTVDQALEHPFLRLYHNQDMIDKVDHAAVTFEFEDIELTRPKIRELILKEVLHYSPECKDQMQDFLGAGNSGDAGRQ